MLVDELIPSATAILFQLLLDRIKHRGFDDGLMLSLVEQILVANQAGVQGIGQQCVDRAFVEGFSTARKAAFRLPLFVQPTTLVDVLDDREQVPEYLAGFRREAIGDRLLREYFIIQFLMVRRSNERSQEATCF